MGAGNAGSGDGRQDAGPNRTVAQKYTPPKAIGVDKFGNTITSTSGNYKTINESGKTVGSSFISEGANKSNRNIDKLPFSGTKVVATMFKGPLAKGAKYNRKAFENLVIGSDKTKGIASTVTKSEWDSMSDGAKESLFSSYNKSRQSGKTDFYGRDVRQEGGGSNTPTVIKKNIGGSTIQTTAPTEAEVSQSETANADAAALKVKKRGRSTSIMTSSKGVTKTASNYSLGKPSLLGQV